MATTIIGTEGARPSLKQNLETLYDNLHAGGAFNVKTNLVTDGSRNGMISGIQEVKHTEKGFKTKMLEGQSELRMVTSGKKTTNMLTSVYGDHSNVKYWNM
jgi:guanyl-specific ribonuclease Sa